MATYVDDDDDDDTFLYNEFANRLGMTDTTVRQNSILCREKIKI